MVNHLEQKFASDQGVAVAYLYCNFGQRREQKLEHLLESILRQLVQQQSSIDTSVEALYDEHKRRGGRPRLEAIHNALLSTAASSFKVFILIDALDECPSESLNGLLSQVFSLQNSCDTSTNFFATSRYIPDVVSIFEKQNVISMDIRASPDDVGKYLENHMSRLPSFVARNPQLQQEIVQEISKAVDGMFLLACFHLHSLIGKRSPRAVRNTLQKLPFGSEGYDTVYNGAMERIEEQTSDQTLLAKQVLSWIICAKWSMTIVQLQHALAIELGDKVFDVDNITEIDAIVSVCAGLIIINEETHVVRLVHYTTQQYFERTWNSWFPNAHCEIGRICLTYLLLDAFGSGICETQDAYISRLDRFPLYEYASRNWAYHIQQQCGTTEENLILELFDDIPKTAACSQTLTIGRYYSWASKTRKRTPAQMTWVHLAAYWGLSKILKLLIDNKNTIDVEDASKRTPLSWASKNGHEQAIRVLLENGANIEYKDKYGQTPLFHAVHNGQEGATDVLLKYGANPRVKDDNGHITRR